jgi:hypothetical protein
MRREQRGTNAYWKSFAVGVKVKDRLLLGGEEFEL